MEQLQYTLFRSKRKTIALLVQPDGSLVVRAPARMAARDIEAFVTARAPWVAAARARMAAQAAHFPPLQMETGAELPWLDRTLTLNLEPRRGALREGEMLRLPEIDPATALEAWCRREARTYLTGRVEALSPVLSVAPTGLKITGARTRWGSCTGRDSLNFTWRLLLCPPEQVDYVVVHELAHIRQKNHSPAFWAVVEAALPDYRTRQAGLKARRGVMDLL